MKRFDVDAQTFRDLQIFGVEKRDKSVFSLFNQTSTLGGSEKLKLIFENPLVDAELLASRHALFSYLLEHEIELNFDKEAVDFIEYFVNQRSSPKPFSKIGVVWEAINNFTGLTQESYNKLRGVHELLDLIKVIKAFCDDLQGEIPELLLAIKDAVLGLLKDVNIRSGIDTRPGILNISQLNRCNFTIRKSLLKEVKILLELIYQLDASVAVVKAGKIYGLSYPILKTDTSHVLTIQGAFHLFLKDPVTNDINFSQDQNVCFVTGVNMAGKSTFLKSVAVCVYLAHLGLPVPAKHMEFSVLDGLITTINLPDSLNEGYSHFYTEVKRVKHVAEKVREAKSMLVIFDELFRGTNVKDAYDASLSIIDSFAKIKSSFFMVSTHITEVAKKLEKRENINFRFLETKMIAGQPVFTYRLQKGITDERLGLWIVENEGIFRILNC
ncbi:MutS-related protein [Pedobacter deserti]|uniref:MutS-related protein n=1 Tax=Pedobacter deserti TaxID=2817382 RepID=UPI00210DD0F1|nr:hypothetical protein [Pedobacter sp. SYSU D00382]